MKCAKHPRYKGANRPKTDCKACERVFKRALRGRLLSEVGKLSEEDQQAVLKSLGATPHKRFKHEFSSEHIRFGYYSDPHVGHKEFREELWHIMLQRFKDEGIKRVYCPGDNLEGMSGRPGHIYELAHVGLDAQLDEAVRLFGLAPELEFYTIDGNHDLWYKSKNSAGAVPGKLLAARCPNVTYLGEWEADIELANGVVMKLFHANDGTAYADSYKLQKLIESFQGGSKPQLVLSGHYHKQIALFRRNIFGFECGTLCGQSEWMRGKKIQAHMGFGIIELWVSPRKEGGIERLRHEFFPFFG